MRLYLSPKSFYVLNTVGTLFLPTDILFLPYILYFLTFFPFLLSQAIMYFTIILFICCDLNASHPDLHVSRQIGPISEETQYRRNVTRPSRHFLFKPFLLYTK
jgi:hypothetical protein